MRFTTTFVSSLFLPKDGTFRSVEKYKECFAALAATEVPIRLYLDPVLRSYGEELERRYPNVKVMKYMTYDMDDVEWKLPAVRHPVKDTADYMSIQLMKLRLVAQTADRGVGETPFYAWVDFGIFHMFNDWPKATEFLQHLATRIWPTDAILSPGCWAEKDWAIWDAICWRHCGSFLLGARDLWVPAAIEQDQLVRAGYPRITWEVNYWAKMNSFRVYKADHNMSILTGLMDLSTEESGASPDLGTKHTDHQSA